MKLPLDKRLKKRLHRDVGCLQDELVDLLYGVAPSLVLHGGTAVWRCFGGARFSEDLDFYLPGVQADFEQAFRAVLHSRGLELLKFKKTANLIFAKVRNRDAEVRVEINFSKVALGVPLAYEKMDGTALVVFCIPLEALVLEKARAFCSRRLIRDVFDVYFLSLQLSDESGRGAFGKELAGLVSSLPAPLDESTLDAIVYSGAVPSFAQMRDYLAGRFP
ncbi:MAG: nucleotidyl transferase AbiEii/AbiGii toxin family protein [Candidatus Micrarchaeota archaeon]